MTTVNQAVNGIVTNEITATITDCKQAFEVLERLAGECKHWNEGAYRTSNQQLYAILAQCLAFGANMDIADARKRSAILEKFYAEKNYVYKKDAPLMTRIVRAVFDGVDRRRWSTYSIVLREAQQQNVLPLQLADWIERNGGVQEIRLAQSKTFVSQKERVAIGSAELVRLECLAVVKADKLERLTAKDKVGAACVLLAEQQADGSFAIKQLLQNSGVVNTALAALYSADAQLAADKQAEQQAANELSLQQAIMNAVDAGKLAA